MGSLDVIEIRTLDGANIFLRRPAIKVQLAVPALSAATLTTAHARWSQIAQLADDDEAVTEGQALAAGLLWPIIRHLHDALDLPTPEWTTRSRDLPGRVGWHDLVLAYGWEWRTVAEGIAEVTVAAANAALADESYDLAGALEQLGEALATDRADDDRPLIMRDAERQIPIVGITGTNGKTTTTRCLTHILTQSGRRVGMANSNGVWIGEQQAFEGDYTGPQGARRVLEDPYPDVAVLETARGGILLRGVAYESNDVGVVTNISADHLGLQGIDTLEGLAEVKSLIVRLTRPGGLVVLNADDPLVRAMAAVVSAPVLFFSRQPESAPISEHLANGGRALFVDGGAIVLADGAARQTVVALSDVPITFGGRAGHMVENALAAAGAAIGLGLDLATISAGLKSFRNSPEQNFGRLNAFAIRKPACTFIVDYAHNEAGLTHLLAFGRSFVAPDARLLAIIGTAGDRTAEALRAIGRLAGEAADFVWVRETEHYLRGRTREAMNELFLAGIADARDGATNDNSIVHDELSAVATALTAAKPGDAIVMMCFEDQAAVLAQLAERGTLIG